jgi:TolA-binding protein
MIFRPSSVNRWLVLVLVLAVTSGCSVYYNTFFNAEKSFNAAEKARKASPRADAGKNDYLKAIEKALKVVETHPNSKYYDDAIFVLGVSYYHTGQFGKSERRFRELLANYPDSKYRNDANLYLAKAKLSLGDMEDALAAFSQVFESDYDKKFKAEAALALGDYHQEQKEYEQARRYFLALRDTLGDPIVARDAQMMIADGYFESFKFENARGAYLQVLGLNPDKDQKYHALYQAAVCSFRLQNINAGLGYLDQLVKDELYFDSLGILKLTMAEGYEYDDDMLAAEALYEDVGTTSESKSLQARAFYRLGLIQQIDYDNLEMAKEYYDKAAEADRASAIHRDAITRSSDIGKLQDFKRTELDSTATPAAIDEAAYAQYLLAELFWQKLNEPDSAMAEMRYLIDSFATSYYAPQAMVALALMQRERTGENQAADSILTAMLNRYPHSDFAPDALEALGLKGTAADTGYAALWVDRAENYLIHQDNPDSAMACYRYVVDNYPDSRYNVSSRFAQIWLKDNYRAPGDSSVYYEYKDFIDSFPGNEWAALAQKQIRSEAVAAPSQTPAAEGQNAPGGENAEFAEEAGAEVENTAAADTASAYVDPMIALYRRGNDTLVDLRLQPSETLIPFEFPQEAAIGGQNDWKLYFQLLVDFSGRVVDYTLKIPTDIEELNKRVSETVKSMTFDAMDVSNRVVDAGQTEKKTEEGYWFVYMYTVSKPEYLR